MTQIPDYIPVVPGLWKNGTEYQDYTSQINGVNLVKTDRRQRLMTCCFANRVYHLSTEPQTCREIIDVSIRFADGNATESELAAAYDRGWELYIKELHQTASTRSATATATILAAATWGASWAVRAAAYANSGGERTQQSRLYGLYLPVVIEPEWRSSATASLAESLYIGDGSVAPVLADELETAGYDGLWIRILRENPEVFFKGMSFIDGLRGVQ